MGYGFPAAIGAKLGNPEKSVIVISGDGGMQMNIQELATAVAYELPLILVIFNNGYLGNYKGHRVIILPQSFEDETNTKKVLDPSYAWIIPTGSGEKPIKVAMEGQTIVDEYVNKDRSREIQVYKKIGVGAKITNNICVYKNSQLN